MHQRFDAKRLSASLGGNIHLFIAPDEQERRELVQKWGINAHTLRSALDPSEVSRLEFGKRHAALIFKRPKGYAEPSRELGTGSIGLFLFKEKLAVVLSEEVPVFDGVGPTDGSLVGVVLTLLDRTLFHFLQHLGLVARISDELQQKISTAMENRHLLSLFELQKGLVYYQGAINSNTAFLELLRRHAGRMGFSKSQRDLLEDILIENGQCYRQVEDLSNVLSNLMDARVSIVNNNLNILIKFLNLLMLSVMVPTLVVSVFPMNLRLPAQEHPYAFWGVLVLAALSSAAFWAYGRGKRW